MQKKNIFNDSVFIKILMAVTFIAMTTTYIIFTEEKTAPKNLLKLLPYYISLLIGFLQSFANRFYLIIGAINSLFYTFAYFMLDTPAMAFYALLFSFPIQLITYFKWSRRSYGNSTVFRRLTKKHLLILAASVAGVWTALYFIFKSFGKPYLILDNTTMLFGILTTFLTFLSYIDAVYFQIFTSSITIVLYIQMVVHDISRIPFLIFSLYSMVCVIRSMRSMLAIYKKQKESGITYAEAAHSYHSSKNKKKEKNQ